MLVAFEKRIVEESGKAAEVWPVGEIADYLCRGRSPAAVKYSGVGYEPGPPRIPRYGPGHR